MYTLPDNSSFHTTIALPIVNVDAGDATIGFRTALAVEIPFMVLALSTVVLRVYSRIAIKKKLAPDDVMIILGLVSSSHLLRNHTKMCFDFGLTVSGCWVCADSYLVHERRRQLGV